MNVIDPKLAIKSNKVPKLLMEIAHSIRRQGGDLYLVGGWVRDLLLSRKTKDFDLEVHKISLLALTDILKEHGALNLVGRSFGVIILSVQGRDYQFALARTESKSGRGHRGFQVSLNQEISFKDAALRRDFTINAMGILLPDLTFVDPCGGLDDLKAGIIRHVSPAFSEDPLRALRAVQFAARLEFAIDPETKKLCGQQPLDDLAKERIFVELKKLLLEASRPSIGFRLLLEMGLLRYFPEILALDGVPQDAVWHPEGDVFTHTMMVIDQAHRIGKEALAHEEHKRLVLMLAALCHDLGKPATTTVEQDGRVRSLNHDGVGVGLTENFLSRLTNERSLIEEVKILVQEHLRPAQLYKDRDNLSKGAIRRLALRVNIEDLVRLARADHLGTGTEDAKNGVFPQGDWLLEAAKALDVINNKPQCFLGGKDLIRLGIKPSPKMGEILSKVFELQLDGKITSKEEAIAWVRSHY